MSELLLFPPPLNFSALRLFSRTNPPNQREIEGHERTIVANEPNADAIPPEDPRHLVIDPARHLNAIKSTVHGQHAIQRSAATCFNKIGPRGGRSGVERCESGKICVRLLGFGSENRAEAN